MFHQVFRGYFNVFHNERGRFLFGHRSPGMTGCQRYVLGLPGSYAATDPSSAQWAFAAEKLMAVDRQRTPWVAVMFHTPWCAKSWRFETSLKPCFCWNTWSLGDSNCIVSGQEVIFWSRRDRLPPTSMGSVRLMICICLQTCSEEVTRE